MATLYHSLKITMFQNCFKMPHIKYMLNKYLLKDCWHNQGITPKKEFLILWLNIKPFKLFKRENNTHFHKSYI